MTLVKRKLPILHFVNWRKSPKIVILTLTKTIRLPILLSCGLKSLQNYQLVLKLFSTFGAILKNHYLGVIFEVAAQMAKSYKKNFVRNIDPPMDL
jgi:hypothetical protein